MNVEFVCPKCGGPLYHQQATVEGYLVVQNHCHKCPYKSWARYDMPAVVVEA